MRDSTEGNVIFNDQLRVGCIGLADEGKLPGALQRGQAADALAIEVDVTCTWLEQTASMRSKVDLPAPFGPMTARRLPQATVNDTASTSIRPAVRKVTASALRTVWLMTGILRTSKIGKLQPMRISNNVTL